MKKLSKLLRSKVRNMTLLDLSVLKLALLSLGTALGVRLAKQLKKLEPLCWLLAILGSAFLLYRLLFTKKRRLRIKI